MDSEAAKGPCPCGASVASGGQDSYIKVVDRSPANRRVQSVSNSFNTFHEPYS